MAGLSEYVIPAPGGQKITVQLSESDAKAYGAKAVPVKSNKAKAPANKASAAAAAKSAASAKSDAAESAASAAESAKAAE